MPQSHSVEEFLRFQKGKEWLLLDARSQKEYSHGHIPGAFNLPLLNDEHRHEVGLTYKQKGREAAVLKGFDLVGPVFGNFVRTVREQTSEKKILIYCWRGGMRSGIMAWILGMAGYEIHLLKGGYKAYRNYVLDVLKAPRNILILGGKTGSGKTEVLQHLAQLGEQVIDLEGLAHHKGSAFGALGQEPQPHYEQFENLLAACFLLTDPDKMVWMENESNTIGSIKIPDPVFAAIRDSQIVEMVVDRFVRKERIHQEYAHFPLQELVDCTAKLKKRLGDLRTREAVLALQESRMYDWLDILLDYYDKTYDYGLSTRKQETRLRLELMEGETHASFAARLAGVVKNQFNKTEA